MSDYSLWKKQDERREANKGVTMRGFTGCLSLIVSMAIVWGLWDFVLKDRIDLRRELSIPYTWPEELVTALTLFVLYLAVQLIFTLLLGFYWKLAGKDQKVEDKMNELHDTWDQR